MLLLWAAPLQKRSRYKPLFTLYIDLSRVFPFWINKLCYLDKIYIRVIPTYLSYRIKRNERSVWGVILNLLIGSLHLLLWHSAVIVE